MKNEYVVQDGMVTMKVQGIQVIFDEADIPIIEKYKWKSPRKCSVNTGYRDENGIGRTLTLHKLLTGAKYVERVNGDLLDYRRCNLVPTEKVIQHHKRGVNLKGNEYRIEKGIVVVLIKSKNKIHECYIDYEDYPIVAKYTWCKNVATGYAQAIDRLTRKGVYMHRLVMGAIDFYDKIDHINGNRMDNRKSNLRICNDSQNHHNNIKHRNGTSGIYPHTKGKYWTACLIVKAKNIHLQKTFKTFEQATAQRRAWEQEFNPSGLG